MIARVELRQDVRCVDDFAKRVHSGLISLDGPLSEGGWSKEKQVRFLESIVFMGLPFGQVYVRELLTGRYVVVDGGQRIQAVLAFMAGDIRLNGVGYEEHPPHTLNRFEMLRISYQIIPFDVPPEVVQDILDRVK